MIANEFKQNKNLTFDESLALSRIKRTLFGAKRWQGSKPKKVKAVNKWKKPKNTKSFTKMPKKNPFWKQSMLKTIVKIELRMTLNEIVLFSEKYPGKNYRHQFKKDDFDKTFWHTAKTVSIITTTPWLILRRVPNFFRFYPKHGLPIYVVLFAPIWCIFRPWLYLCPIIPPLLSLHSTMPVKGISF